MNKNSNHKEHVKSVGGPHFVKPDVVRRALVTKVLGVKHTRPILWYYDGPLTPYICPLDHNTADVIFPKWDTSKEPVDERYK